MTQKNRKGLSPLIAAVLLIAFVMSTGVILSSWIVKFTREEGRDVTERGGKEIDCSYSALTIDVTEYNTTNQRTIMEVENTGRVDLSDFRIQAAYDNNTVSGEIKPSDYNVTLKEGGVRFFTNTGNISSNIDKVSIYSEECPVQSRTWIERKHMSIYS